MVLRDLCYIKKNIPGMYYGSDSLDNEAEIARMRDDTVRKKMYQKQLGKGIAERGEIYETDRDVICFALTEDGEAVKYESIPKEYIGVYDQHEASVIRLYGLSVLIGEEYQLISLNDKTMFLYIHAKKEGKLIADSFGFHYEKMSDTVKAMIDRHQNVLYCHNSAYSEEDIERYNREISQIKAKYGYVSPFHNVRQPQMKSAFYNDYVVIKYPGISGEGIGNPFACRKYGYTGHWPFGYANVSHVCVSEKAWKSSPYYMDKEPMEIVDINTMVSDLLTDEITRPFMQ